MGEDPSTIGLWMSWVPFVGGSIGVVLGGFISDRVVKRVGPYSRLLVLIASQVRVLEALPSPPEVLGLTFLISSCNAVVSWLLQLLAAPFVAGALYLKPPAAFAILIPGYIIGKLTCRTMRSTSI